MKILSESMSGKSASRPVITLTKQDLRVKLRSLKDRRSPPRASLVVWDIQGNFRTTAPYQLEKQSRGQIHEYCFNRFGSL